MIHGSLAIGRRRASPAAAPAPGRLPAALLHHRSLMLGVTAGVIAYAAVTDPLSATAQLALLAAAVAIVGLPHGALDHLVARHALRPRLGRWWWAGFGAAYLLIAAAVALLWILAPPASLVAFLLLSAVHFGWDDPFWVSTGRGWWSVAERFSVGSLPILLPTWLHPTEVSTIFVWLMPGRHQIDSAAVAAVAGLAAAVLLPIAALRAARLLGGGLLARGAAAELAAIAALNFAAPPLLAFLTYFCGWHSVRHALELANDLDPSDLAAGLRRFGRSAVPLTTVAIAAGALAAWGLQRAALPAHETLATVIFVGLSVLTVPHMATTALGRWSSPER